MDNIKILFVDLDGTLTNSKQEISEYTKDILKKATNKGIYIIICSGRPNIYTIKKSQLANATNIVISDNGALIYDYYNNKTIYENPISEELLKRIFDFSINNNIGCAFNATLKRYKTVNCDKDAIAINTIDDLEENITQIVLDTNEYEKVELIESWIKHSGIFEICNCSSSVLYKKKDAEKYEFDIVLKGTTKGKAIKVLLNYLGIAKKDSICFGDHINDYSMFEECGYKVAMENGMKEIKDKADFVTSTNNENGVATFMENNIL